MMKQRSSVVLEEVTDATERAAARVQDERFERNFRWFQSHAIVIFRRYRGKSVVIAGQGVFAADKPAEAWALAEAAHPDDNGSFIQYVPKKKVARIYACRWRVGSL